MFHPTRNRNAKYHSSVVSPTNGWKLLNDRAEELWKRLVVYCSWIVQDIPENCGYWRNIVPSNVSSSEIVISENPNIAIMLHKKQSYSPEQGIRLGWGGMLIWFLTGREFLGLGRMKFALFIFWTRYKVCSSRKFTLGEVYAWILTGRESPHSRRSFATFNI